MEQAEKEREGLLALEVERKSKKLFKRLVSSQEKAILTILGLFIVLFN